MVKWLEQYYRIFCQLLVLTSNSFYEIYFLSLDFDGVRHITHHTLINRLRPIHHFHSYLHNILVCQNICHRPFVHFLCIILFLIKKKKSKSN